jgi:hypothetical protein
VTNPRPIAVTTIATFLFVASAIAAIVGFEILFPNPVLDRIWEWNKPGAALFRSIGPIAGVFLWVLSIAVLAAARALLRGHPWPWWFAIALFTIDGAGDLVSYPFTHDLLRTIFGAAVSSAFLIVLARPAVRRYCGVLSA